MIIVDKQEYARRDEKSGKTIGDLLKSYYEHGWDSFMGFYDQQDWAVVRQFEKDPDAVVVDGRLVWGHDDVGPAKRKLLEYACEQLAEETIQYLEFGVRAGVSMGQVSRAQQVAESSFHGFDTFEGLPEDWVPAWGGRSIANASLKGDMAAEMPVFEDTRVSLYKGLIQDTLPKWLADHALTERLFINIDTDLYTAALYVLTTMHPFLKPGDLVYFDELHDELNEFAAFNDYVRSYYVRDRFRLLGRAYDAYLFQYC